MSDNFWEQKVGWKEAGDRTDGAQVIRTKDHWRTFRHYVAYPYSSTRNREALGFAGALWVFRLSSGEITISNNVWDQGEIPVEYRDRLPANATLLECECGRRAFVGDQRELPPYTLCETCCETCCLVLAFNPQTVAI